MDLIAQAASGIDWGRVIAPNGLWIFLIICGGGGIASGIVATILHHRKEVMQHNERMAMIDAGMHPDRPQDAAETEDNPDDLKQTSDYTHLG